MQYLLGEIGVSEEARWIDQASGADSQSWQNSNVLGNEQSLDELGVVWCDCQQPNWDGYGAIAVSNETLRHAFCFLETLPMGTSSPSVGAEPDGAITFEWYRAPRRTLSVSVADDGFLHYAVLIGLDRRSGKIAYYDEVPHDIVNLIDEID